MREINKKTPLIELGFSVQEMVNLYACEYIDDRGTNNCFSDSLSPHYSVNNNPAQDSLTSDQPHTLCNGLYITTI